jgi:lipoprotein-anchoring transpeptidase ErfK/SrfK
VSPASSSRRRSRASLIAALALAFLCFGGGARAEAASEALVPAAGLINWAQVAVRAQPDRQAQRTAVLSQFRPDFRPRVVLALGVRRATSGKPAWYRISLPGRPNGRTGWVPAESVDLKPIRKEIVIDRSARTLELRNAGGVELTTRVAVGAYGMETPLGRFYVMAKFRPTAPILGAFGFETSAYSKLSEWPGGGVVGIHGTNTPSLLGQAVSHGCIRVANEAILRLKDLVPVGTPIRIVE